MITASRARILKVEELQEICAGHAKLAGLSRFGVSPWMLKEMDYVNAKGTSNPSILLLRIEA